MIAFELTDDQKMMTESVAQLARAVLRPNARAFEAARAIPDAVQRTAHELGLSRVALPESLGGAGLGLVTAVLLEEEVAWGDPSAGFALAGPGAFGFALLELASAAQAHAALAPFSEPDAHARFGAVAWGEPKPNRERAGFSTIATKTSSGYAIDGIKAYVVNADRASQLLVFAQVDPSAGLRGIGAFLVDAHAKGVELLPRSTTLGLDAVSFGGVKLTDVHVSEDARLSAHPDQDAFSAGVIRFFARHSVLVAARAVGLARAAFEATREYVDTRRAFGKPIGHFQAVAFTVADRAMDVDAARALVWRAAAAWDAFDAGTGTERDCLLASAEAVAFAHEAAMRCGDDAVQLHGGAGFMRDYLVEKCMRDAKQIGLCTLTAEHADQLAGALTLGVPLDPAHVLPTPETQNAFV